MAKVEWTAEANRRLKAIHDYVAQDKPGERNGMRVPARGAYNSCMVRVAWQERIEVSPDLRHGEPCVRGTRIPVALLVGSLADGMTEAEILQEYPQLTAEDIRAALAFAAEALRLDTFAPLP